MSAPTSCNTHDLEQLIPQIAARARRLTRTPEDAQDLAQDTALKLWQQLQRKSDIADLEAYAMITLRNLAVTGWRNRPMTEELRDDQASCPPDAMARLALADLMTAIDKLPEDQSVLLGRVAEGDLSPAALAKTFGVPTGTVMSRLARARRTLRSDLDLSHADTVAALL